MQITRTIQEISKHLISPKIQGKIKTVANKEVQKSQNSAWTQEACDTLRAMVCYTHPKSVETDTAVQMNRQAVHEIRDKIKKTFINAIPEDLKILKNPEIRTYKYQNPKTGNSYHLIDQGKDENGNVTLRVLDSTGAFVKEVAVKPKKVVIIDDFSTPL